MTVVEKRVQVNFQTNPILLERARKIVKANNLDMSKSFNLFLIRLSSWFIYSLFLCSRLCDRDAMEILPVVASAPQASLHVLILFVELSGILFN